MGDLGKTRVRFSVVIDIDNDDWLMNYGNVDATPMAIRDDVCYYMRTVIEELVKHHIDTTGNTGAVSVSGGVARVMV